MRKAERAAVCAMEREMLRSLAREQDLEVQLARLQIQQAIASHAATYRRELEREIDDIDRRIAAIDRGIADAVH